MSDKQDLRKLAEDAVHGFEHYDPPEAAQEFMYRIKPSDVVALLDELEACKADAELLRLALESCADELECQVVQCYHGMPVEEMHPVTRRSYDRDMAAVQEARAAMKNGSVDG